MADRMPDLVIGVDFGTTGTAVVYSLAGKDPQVMCKWPGMKEDRNKIPTVVSYYEDGNPHNWGFAADSTALIDEPNIAVYRDLKTSFFDRNMETVYGGPAEPGSPHNSDPDQHLAYFLGKLYQHIKATLKGKIETEWNRASIGYAFSYPTTWKENEEIVHKFREITEKAGFIDSEAYRRDYSDVLTWLDEARCAMYDFFSKKNKPQAGQNVMVADIGGGTSDIGMFRIDSYEDGTPIISTLKCDQGTEAGSVNIDKGIGRTLKSRLHGQLATKPLPGLTNAEDANTRVDREVNRMIQSIAYIDAKCAHGSSTEDASLTDIMLHHHLYVDDPRVPHGSAMGVERLERSRLNKMFQEQCAMIWKQIENHIKTEFEGRLHHFVLTGGLGSSQYVCHDLEQKLEARFRQQPPQFHHETKTDDGKTDYETTTCKGLVEFVISQITGKIAWGYKSTAHYGITKAGTNESLDASWFLRQGEVVALSKKGNKRKPWTKDFSFKAGRNFTTGLRIVKMATGTDGKTSCKLVGKSFMDTATPEEWDKIKKSKRFLRSAETVKLRLEIRPYRGEFEVRLLQEENVIAELLIREHWHDDPFLERPSFWERKNVKRNLGRVGPAVLGVLPILGTLIVTVLEATGVIPSGTIPKPTDMNPQGMEGN